METYLSPALYRNENIDQIDVLVVSAGFEERSCFSLSQINLSKVGKIILVHFLSEIEENETAFICAKEIISRSGFSGILREVPLDYHNPKLFEKEFTDTIQTVSIMNEKVYLDISGFPTYAICQALRIIRNFCPAREQFVIYTSAKEYFPLKSEYDAIISNNSSNDISYLPTGMSLEMSDNLFLEPFSGYRSNGSSSCLAVFCGYEIHRSAGVIENINPSKLLMLYGKPGDPSMQWRLDFSRKMHHRFEATRNVATEIVSTLDIRESLSVLEKYYEFLFDDHDLSIAPVCSKMQTVATYLFWERYKEVQLVFPIPIGHSVKKSAQGAFEVYIAVLPPINTLYLNRDRIDAPGI